MQHLPKVIQMGNHVNYCKIINDNIAEDTLTKRAVMCFEIGNKSQNILRKASYIYCLAGPCWPIRDLSFVVCTEAAGYSQCRPE